MRPCYRHTPHGMEGEDGGEKRDWYQVFMHALKFIQFFLIGIFWCTNFVCDIMRTVEQSILFLLGGVCRQCTSYAMCFSGSSLGDIQLPILKATIHEAILRKFVVSNWLLATIAWNNL